MKHFCMSFFLGLLLLLSYNRLNGQSEKLIFTDRSDRIKQFLMINDEQAIALAKGTGQFKLVNTLLLIENGRIIDSLVQRGSLDYIRILSDSHFTVFRPTASLLHVYVEEGKLKVGDVAKIPYDKIIWSTNFEEAVLTHHEGITVSFNQGSAANSLNPRDSNSTPVFKLYFDAKMTDVNPVNEKATYDHWPTYSKGVMPPMNLIRIVNKTLIVILSNIGEYYSVDTNSKSIDIHKFPTKNNVSSWSVFYDRITEKEYFVAYNDDDSFSFFTKEGLGKTVNNETVKGFADVIINGQVLITKKANGGSTYLLKPLK